VANIGKSVGITTANVVRAPIQRSFVLEENLAEVAAKTSAQQVVADNLGLAVAVLAT
jgi:glutamate N-acetyltransferase/amino-acid N-acetyltransferase